MAHISLVRTFASACSAFLCRSRTAGVVRRNVARTLVILFTEESLHHLVPLNFATSLYSRSSDDAGLSRVSAVAVNLVQLWCEHQGKPRRLGSSTVHLMASGIFLSKGPLGGAPFPF